MRALGPAPGISVQSGFKLVPRELVVAVRARHQFEASGIPTKPATRTDLKLALYRGEVGQLAAFPGIEGMPPWAQVLANLSLLKNLSDHGGRSSATATVGHARRFVCSRDPVTGPNREPRSRPETRIRAAYAMTRKEGISPKRPRESTFTVVHAARRSYR